MNPVRTSQLIVVTTNAPLEEVREISRGRIYSRLMEMCSVVEMAGPEWEDIVSRTCL